MQNFNNIKKKFFESFIKNTSFDGVSITSLEKSSLDLNMDSSYHKILFPGGLEEIIEYYYKEQLMLHVISNIPDISSITGRVKAAVELAIIDNPFPKAFRNKIAKFYLSPIHANMPAKFAWYFSDMVWKHLNDKSTDFNYYSKRSILFSVYSSSMLYYLKDNSDEYQDTRKFIEKSLNKILSFSKLKNKIILGSEQLKNIPIIRMFL